MAPLRDPERLDLPSASALEIAVRCPGQPNLKRNLPPEAFATQKDAPDPDADRGTRIHKAFETGDTKELNEEEAEAYKAGVEFENMIVDRWMVDKDREDCYEGKRELRLFLNSPTTLEPIGSGKLDRHYVSLPHLLVIDLKSGWNPNLPPSPKSWQLRFQAVLLWQEFEAQGVSDVRVAHCKPKSTYGASDVCDYSKQDLEYSLQSILFHLWETTQPDAQRNAGSWCAYCPCKGFCPEAGARSLLPSVIAAESPDLMARKFDPAEGVSLLKPVDLYRIWDASSIVGKIIDAVKARLKAMPKDELAAIGLELGKGKNIEEITNPKAVLEYLIFKAGLTEDQVYRCMNFSKGSLVDVLRDKLNLTEQGAQQWLSANLNSWIVRKTSEAPLKKIK